MSTLNVEMIQQCELVQILSDSTAFKVVKAGKILIDFAGILLIIFESLLKKKTSKMYHPNAVVIVQFIRIVLTINCMAYIAIHIYDLYRVTIPVESPCLRLANAKIVFFLRLITIVANVTLVASFQMMAIERIICTKFVTKYETTNKPKLVLMALLLLSGIYSALAYLAVFYNFGPMNPIFSSSARTPTNAKTYIFATCCVIAGSILIAILFVIIRVWNAKLAHRLQKGAVNYSNQHYILSIKFQLKETMKIMDYFIPIALAMFLFYFFTYVLIVAVNYLTYSLEGNVRFAWLTEGCFMQTMVAHAFAGVGIYKAKIFSKVNSKTTGISVTIESREAYYQRQNNWFAFGTAKQPKSLSFFSDNGSKNGEKMNSKD